jgi:hypothetical protein
VTGNTYRNPTLLAKAVTTLDVVSAGRAILGIGAGWFELEHRQLGFEFGKFTERFEKLEEASWTYSGSAEPKSTATQQLWKPASTGVGDGALTVSLSSRIIH